MMKRQTTRIALFLVIGWIVTSTLALADGAVAPLGIVPTPTPQPLTVQVWTDRSTYTVGETLTIFFSVNRSSYIYIYDIQPNGFVRLIFPNQYSRRNFVSAGTHSLPDGLYKFTVTPPAGTEHLQIFASPVDLGLNPSYFGEPFPLVGSDPSSAANQIQAQIMGIIPEPTWSTAWTSFTIRQAYSYTPPTYYYPYPPSYPPFPGYPGGTWYWQGGGWQFGIPQSGWYWYFGPDGKWHFRIHIHIGGN